MSSIKEKLAVELEGAIDEATRAVKKSNTTKPFLDIYVWQEISRLADERCKEAWKQAQEEDGLLPDDDAMRALGEGEHIVEEAGQFSCVVNLTAPVRRFNQETFADLAAKKLRIPRQRIVALMEDAKVAGKGQLKKRILDSK